MTEAKDMTQEQVDRRTLEREKQNLELTIFYVNKLLEGYQKVVSSLMEINRDQSQALAALRKQMREAEVNYG